MSKKERILLKLENSEWAKNYFLEDKVVPWINLIHHSDSTIYYKAFNIPYDEIIKFIDEKKVDINFEINKHYSNELFYFEIKLNQMKKIIRFINEFFNSSLICKRKEHKINPKTVIIRKRTYHGGLCSDFYAKLNYCKRCHKIVGEPYELKMIRTYTSVTMSVEKWNTMDSLGYTLIRIVE